MFLDDSANYEVEIFDSKEKTQFFSLESAKAYCLNMLANGHTALLYIYCDFSGDLIERKIYQHEKHNKRIFRKTKI